MREQTATTSKSDSKVSVKRSGYLEWNEYFMAIAFLSAQRSKDPRTQVGACIVNSEKKIVGIGYNGMPIGCSDDLMPWNRAEDGSKENWLESKTPYVCHAELNAVLNKNLADIKGCVIYVALFPCNMCAQIIIQSRISEVIYYSDKYHDRPEFEASRRMFDTAGVKYWQFHPRQKKISIEFDLIESTPGDVPTLPSKSRLDNTDAEVTSNSNNSGALKNFRIENHAEQQQLQNIDHLQLQFPQQQIFWSRGPQWFSNMYEFYFAILSTLLIILFAIVIWHFNNSN